MSASVKSSSSIPTRFAAVVAGGALLGALLVGSGLTNPAPAEAACRGSAYTSNRVIAGVLHTYLSVNACTAQKLHSQATAQLATVNAFAGVLIPFVGSSAGRNVAAALGSYQGLTWLKQRKLKTCTASFTHSATITFVRGVPTVCTTGTRDRSGGGSF